jgi:peroxidase
MKPPQGPPSPEMQRPSIATLPSLGAPACPPRPAAPAAPPPPLSGGPASFPLAPPIPAPLDPDAPVAVIEPPDPLDEDATVVAPPPAPVEPLTNSLPPQDATATAAGADAIATVTRHRRTLR